MQKVVVNRCFGGYSLSDRAMERYAEIAGFKVWKEDDGVFNSSFYKCPKEEYDNIEPWNEKRAMYFSHRDIKRDDPILIQVIEEIGCKEASGWAAELEIVLIPDGVIWEIHEYDGRESVHEKHRSW